jgi:hypothetical protein
MTRNYCDRCGIEIGEAVAKETINVSIIFYDDDGNNLPGTSGDFDLCRPCADVVLQALVPIKPEEVNRG